MLGAQPASGQRWRARRGTADREPGGSSVPPSPARSVAARRLGRGPHQLGRNVVVAGGSDAPAEWSGCERIRIDATVVRRTLGDRRASARRRLRAARRRDRARRRHRRRPPSSAGRSTSWVRDSRSTATSCTISCGRTPSTGAIPTAPQLVARRSGGGARRRVRWRRRHRAPRRHGRLARRWAGPLHRSDRRRPGAPRRRRRARIARAAAVERVGRRSSPPTSSPPSCTPVAPPASSPRPDPARRACSPSEPATCSSAGGCRRAPSASSPSTSGPRRRCASARPTCPGLQVRTLNAIALAIVNGVAPFLAQPRYVADDRRTRRPPRAVEADRLPEAPQHRSGRAVDRGVERDPARAGRPARGRAAVRRRRRRARRGVAEVPRRARTRGRRRLRRPDLPGDRDPRRPARRPGGGATCVPPHARRRVPGPHPGPPACSSACCRRPAARCSASATTTRRSTATTAPIRAG